MIYYVCAGVGSVILYFYDYHQPPGKPPLTHSLAHPVNALAYYLSWLGSPLVPEGSPLGSSTRAVVGGCVLGVYVLGVLVTSKSHLRGEMLGQPAQGFRPYPWAILGLFSVISGAVVTVGRSGSGLEQAADSRYATFSLFLVIATIMFGAELLGRWGRRLRRPAVLSSGAEAVALLIILLLHGQAAIAAHHGMHAHGISLRRAKTALLLHRVAPDMELLETLYPDGNHVIRAFARLKSHGQLNYDAMELPAFREGCSGAAPPDPANGWLDVWARRGEQVAFRGWVRLGNRGLPGTNVILTWAGSDSILHPLALALPGVARPDVAELLHDGRFARCGFTGTGSLQDVPPGRVRLDAWTVDTDDWSVHHLANARPFLTRPGSVPTSRIG